jgi:choice-of-anchor B domain-containing protein
MRVDVTEAGTRTAQRALREYRGIGLCCAVLWMAACGGSTSSPTPVAAPTPAPVGVNMTLLSRMDLSALGPGVGSAAGNWGYVSPQGRVFALTGVNIGLSIVEITDPTKPRSIALIPGGTSQWREIRTYGEFIYVTTEANTGLDIIDMRDPDRPAKIQTWSETFTSAHSLYIDRDRGLLFANGTKNAARVAQGVRVLDVGSNPANPREVGSFRDFYIHDLYARGNTIYAAAINDGFLAILDSSQIGAIREVTRFLTGGRFTHNAWLTADSRYVFTTDERASRPLEAWDIANPLSPRKVSEYIARPEGIPHNVLVDGNRMVVSHYVDGVHLLDVSRPDSPRLMGSYDTYAPQLEGFHGCWGAYIFEGSNLIIASDIEGGLFVLQYTGP